MSVGHPPVVIMLRQYQHTIATIALLALTGCGRRGGDTAPEDPFQAIGASPVPVVALAGGSALLLPVGVFVLGDTAARDPALLAQRYALSDSAFAILDTTLKREARSARWLDPAEQRRALRMAVALGIEPERLDATPLLGAKVEAMTDPLWSQLRTLEGMTGARIAVAPAGVKLERRETGYTASYVLVMVDSRTGKVLWRGRSDGAAPSPEAALRSAAAAAIPPLPR